MPRCKRSRQWPDNNYLYFKIMSLQKSYSKQFDKVLQHLNIEETDKFILLRSLIIKRSVRKMGFGSLILECLKSDAGQQRKILICSVGVPAWKLRKWYLARGLFNYFDPEHYEYMVYMPKSLKLRCFRCDRKYERFVSEGSNMPIYTCRKCHFWRKATEYLDGLLLEMEVQYDPVLFGNVEVPKEDSFRKQAGKAIDDEKKSNGT